VYIIERYIYYHTCHILHVSWSRRGCDRIVVGFTTTCVISAYHHLSCEFKPRSWWGVLKTTLCDKVCQWRVAGRWFSPGTPVSSTNKTDRHDIVEILLKVSWPLIMSSWIVWYFNTFVETSNTIKQNCFTEDEKKKAFINNKSIMRCFSGLRRIYKLYILSKHICLMKT
jgi:hypothetical protein